jgi:thioredoxin-related protein
MKKTALFLSCIALFQSCWLAKPEVSGNDSQSDSANIDFKSFPNRIVNKLDTGSRNTPEPTKRETVPFEKDKSTMDSSKLLSGDKMKSPTAINLVPKTLTWLDFESGYSKAVKENKILMVEAYTDWCHSCKVMDRETFSDSTVIRTLNTHFVTVKLNPEKDRTFRFGDTTMNQVELYRWLGYGNTFGFPTTYFWISPGKSPERDSLAGYNEPKAFMEILGQITAKKK